MRLLRFVSRRIVYLSLQVLGVMTLTFVLERLIPGNPAIVLAGKAATPETVHSIERQLGLDKPLPVQYLIYLSNLVHGQLGSSIYTDQPVIRDIEQRVPATFELVTVSMLIVVLVGIPLGMYSASHPRGIVSRATYLYGQLSGAIPDFWLGLMLIFVFFFSVRWLPPPLGQTGLLPPPPHRTGIDLIDSLFAGDIGLFGQVVAYLTLPTVTLVLTNMGNVVKMAHSSMEEVAHSDFVEFARACGLPRQVVLRYALRNALPPVITVVAFTYGILLGGAVLVEVVFSWDGMGQYAVQSVKGSDYAALTGFVLFAALFMAAVYLLLDIVYAWVDPRIQLS